MVCSIKLSLSLNPKPETQGLHLQALCNSDKVRQVGFFTGQPEAVFPDPKCKFIHADPIADSLLGRIL